MESSSSISCGAKQGLVCVGVNTSESLEGRNGGQGWLITVGRIINWEHTGVSEQAAGEKIWSTSDSARLLQPVFGTSAETHARSQIESKPCLTLRLICWCSRWGRTARRRFGLPQNVSMRTKMAVLRGNDRAVVKKGSSKKAWTSNVRKGSSPSREGSVLIHRWSAGSHHFRICVSGCCWTIRSFWKSKVSTASLSLLLFFILDK